MKLCIVLLVLCCAALQHTDAIQFGRWPLRWWPRPGPIGIYRPDIEKPFKVRDVDAEVDQSDDEDFDEAELEKLFSERDVLDLMEELDDDDDDIQSADDVNDKQ